MISRTQLGGGITLKDNKIEFLQELSPFLTDNTPTLLENASFLIRQGKTLFNVRGVGLGLKRISDETFHLIWECGEILELPKPCDFRLEEVKRLEKRSTVRTITLNAEKFTTKTRQDIENAGALLGDNNPENLKSRINKVLGSTNAKTNVAVRLPSSQVRLLEMKRALAMLFPRKKKSDCFTETLPTHHTIHARKTRLLEFLEDRSSLDSYWTAIPADWEINLREVDWLVHQLKPSVEVLISIWEAAGMPISVFNALREDLADWWKQKREKSATSKKVPRKFSRWGKKPKKT